MRQSTFPGMATRAPTLISSCRWSNTRSNACGASSSCRSRRLSRRSVAAIMTAHVLVPALDEERPATLSPADRVGLLRDELGIRRRHLERRSRNEGDRQRTTRCRQPPFWRLQAGCDGVLDLRRRSRRRRSAALEALIHAVEDGTAADRRVSRTRSTRQQRAKERFLRPRPPSRVRSPDGRCARLGRDEHQRDRRRDGALHACQRCGSRVRARPGRSPRRRRSRQPVRPRRVRSPASTRFERLGFDAGLRRHRCSSAARRYLRAERPCRAAIQRAWRGSNDCAS